MHHIMAVIRQSLPQHTVMDKEQEAAAAAAAAITVAVAVAVIAVAVVVVDQIKVNLGKENSSIVRQ